MKAALGVCYYPEHWPEELWAQDARQMADAGLSIVRIGEFAWSRLEPEPGNMQWQWLDLAIETLSQAGLRVVLGTPTATPPRWMLDLHPDMLAVGDDGAARKFGSRRHYCFSHNGYREQAARIAAQLAERYGQLDALCGWQLDNEYGCHSTLLSYSDVALAAFRQWLQEKYVTTAALNSAWGNVFWSMEYSSFEQIELPTQTVTTPNPAHVLDFRRFSSDQLIRFNRAQVDAIRANSDLPLMHNYMGQFTDFDHYRLAEDLDIAAWDSYPLGFLQMSPHLQRDTTLQRSDAFEDYYRQGNPDFQAFHHDLYRSVGNGRWWIAEQQPGPVNWATYNPAPLAGMVRLWTWEAIAHQAEAVCYFRWRQAPFAQEQMHAGLLNPDSTPATGLTEAVQVAEEIEAVGELAFKQAEVAIVFDYESCWAWEAQPQGKGFSYFKLVFDCYQALRKLGLSIDFVAAKTDTLNPYKLVLIPGLMYWPENLPALVRDFNGQLLIGPRSGSKTANFSIPDSLPPGIDGLDCKVTKVASLPPGISHAVAGGGHVHTWLESLEGEAKVVAATEEGEPVLVADDNIHYLGAWPDDVFMHSILQNLCVVAAIDTTKLPNGVRIRGTKSHRFVFNYGSKPATFEGKTLEPAFVDWQGI